MPAQNDETIPYWATSATFPQFAKLTEDLVADVVVVGAGVTGLSTAYLLAKAGQRVVVLERDRCAMGDTGHTSAHLTMVTDVRLTELVTRFGRNRAQAAWEAGLAAIATIDEVVRAHAIDADFAWVDGYLHAPLTDETNQETAGLRAEGGSPASWGSTRSTWRSSHLSIAPASGSRIRRAFNHGHTWPASPKRSWQWEAVSTSTRRPTSSATSRAR